MKCASRNSRQHKAIGRARLNYVLISVRTKAEAASAAQDAIDEAEETYRFVQPRAIPVVTEFKTLRLLDWQPVGNSF
jgi:hypothetical protein